MPTLARALVRPALLALAAATAATTGEAAPARVVVVGGGIGGLAALHRLRAGGADAWLVTERVGGRIEDALLDAESGLLANAGAEFVNRDHERLIALAGELGVPLDPSDLDGTPRWVVSAGRWVPEDEFARRQLVEQGDALDAIAADRVAALAAEPGPEALGFERALDQESAEEYLQRRGARGPLAAFFRAALESENGLPWGRLSARVALEAFEIDRDRGRIEFPAGQDEALRVRGGTFRLVEALRARHGDRIREGARLRGVRRVAGPEEPDERGKEALELVFEREGSGGETRMIAAAAVIAIPGWERPGLRFGLGGEATGEQVALAAPTYGAHTKLFLRFRRELWEGARAFRLGRAVSDRGMQLWDRPPGPGEPYGVITAYLGQALGPEDEDERGRWLERALRELEGLEPAIRSSFAGASWRAWRSSYAGARQPGEPSTAIACRVPFLGRSIAFAGDYLGSESGYLEDAVRSGEAAAERSLARTERPPMKRPPAPGAPTAEEIRAAGGAPVTAPASSARPSR